MIQWVMGLSLVRDDGVRLREFESGDLEGMFRLDEVCFEMPFRFTREDMARFAEAKRARVVVAEVGGELVGFCIVHVSASSGGYVVTLDVAPGYRLRGLAARMMRWGEDRAREAKCGEMVLHVFEGNAEAVRFYERVGYGFSHRAADFYGPGLGALVYRKGLRGGAVVVQ